MQAINMSNAVSGNYFSMAKIRLNETVKAQTGETESNIPSRTSIMIQSMYKVRAFDNGTDVLELSQNAPTANVPNADEAVPEEASSGNAQEISNVMEKFKLKIMGTDEDGDKFKLMLHYSFKEVGANNLSQEKLRISMQGELEVPPAEESVETESPNVDLIA